MPGTSRTERKKDIRIDRLKSEILELKNKLKEKRTVESKLLKKEAVYKDILDTLQEGVAYATLSGILIEINHSLEQLMGVPQEKVIGRNILDLASEFLDPADSISLIEQLKQILAGNEIEPIQFTYKHKTLEVCTSINRKTKKLTGTFRDITETKRITEALTKSEIRLKRAELSSKCGNWELHLKTGKMIGSDGALKLYGIKAGTMEYNDIRDIPLPEYRQMMDEALNDLITNNKPYNIEFKIKKADTGEVLDLYSVSEFDRENNILYGSIQDITHRKKIEEQLLKKNRDLSRLFMMSLHLLESAERKKVLEKIAENAANLVGTDTSAIYLLNGEDLQLEATSPPLPENFPDEFRIAKLIHHPHVAKTIKTGNIVIITDVTKVKLTAEEQLIVDNRNLGSMVYIPLFIQKKVGGVIILGTIGRKHYFEKDEIDLFNTFSNITSLALDNSYLIEHLKITKEKAEESSKLKTAFLHNISHEIRTPLNAIVGFSGLLGDHGLTPEAEMEYLGIISQSNNQLLSIVDDILNISHIEAGQVSVTETKTNLNIILNNIYRQYYPEAAKLGLEFNIKNGLTNADALIMTDENKIIGIITNLLNNALKFTHEGSVELGCNRIDSFIEFYIADTGIGIAESEQSKIFERFYQINTSAARVYGGMGLGLSISAAYVIMLGGKFTLKSSPGKGSRFAFTIPYKKTESDDTPEVKYIKEASGYFNTGRTILVAEDEDSSYAFIREVLRPLGYNLIRAFNGNEAVDICKANENIDLILMDIRMPEKNGYDSASDILKFRPNLPIIVQTAYSYPDDQSIAMENGCIDYLTKPFSKGQLIAMVEKYQK